jgi:subtilisin-like proprotein convertase family protein
VRRAISRALLVVAFVPVVIMQGAQPATAAGTATFGPSAAVTVNDAASATPSPSSLSVAGQTGLITKVTVSLDNLSHTSADDIDALLVAPDGKSIKVMSDIADGGLTVASGANLTFDDAAVAPLNAGGTVTSGTYRPTDRDALGSDAFPGAPASAPADTFAHAFNGIDANGTWSLYVVDDSTGDAGTIAGGWSLTIVTSTRTATTTALGSSLNPSHPGDPVTFTATVTSGGPVTSGTVTFLEGATLLPGGAAVPVDGAGNAVLTVPSFSEGPHAVTAFYGGTATFGASRSSLSQGVDTATTAVGNTFCNAGPITIPDHGAAAAYPSHVTVSGIDFSAGVKINAQLKGVSHAVPVDIDALVVGPTGLGVELMSDVGGTSPISGVDLGFDGSAPDIPVAGPLPTGTYKPTNDTSDGADTFPPPAPVPSPATQLGSFRTANPNGTWSLYVHDDATGDGGSIGGGWCLTVTPLIQPTHFLVSAPPTALPGSAFNFTVTAQDGANATTPDYTGIVHFTSTDGAATLPANTTLTNGVGTFSATLPTRGLRTITATDTVTPSITGTSAAIHVTDVALSAAAPVITEAPGGDGDGIFEPGESVRLTLPVSNVGTGTANGVNGALSLTSGTATVTTGASAYPSIPAGTTKNNTTPYAVSIGSGQVCGAPVKLSHTVTTNTADVLTYPVVVPTGGPAPPTSLPSPDVPKPIPDISLTTSNLFLSSSENVGSVAVRLNLTHTSDNNLSITLESPSGTRVALATNRGGAGDNFTNTVFDDAAASPIGAGAAPFTGAFRPEAPLSAMSGEVVEGVWHLEVADGTGGDGGDLVSWSLDLRGLTNHLSSDVPKPITDFSTTTSSLPIVSSGLLEKVTVSVTLTHTFDSDLAIVLVSPSGTRVALATYRGGGGDNYTGTVFDDAAANPISAGSAPFTSPFRPESPLSVLRSEPIGGTWKLEVSDDAGADSGSLSSWSLNVSSPQCATLPGAPTGVAATVLNPTQASVVFVAPASNGGSPVTSYYVQCTSSSGGVARSATGPASPITVSALTTGATYTCRVRATNAAGTGPYSGSSASFVPAVVAPGPPSGVTVAPAPTSASVAFAAPATDGGSAITSYYVQCTSTNGGAARSGTGPASPITVTALTTGSSYSCRVRATNGVGTGAYSAFSAPFVPAPVAPGAPSGVVVTVTGPTSTSVAFTAPASNGGSAITSYYVQCTSSTGGAARSGTGAASPVSVTLLTTGATYQCRTRATNAVGTGPYSAYSASFVPTTVAPGAPSNVVVTVTGATSASVSFAAPASDGGSAITSYYVQCTSTNGGAARSGTGASSPISVTGLTTGSSYTCRARATNGVGTGAYSTPSAAFIPA